MDNQPTIVTPFQFKSLRVLFGVMLATLIALFGALALKSYRQSQFVGKPDNVRDSITISGHGDIVAIPDIATVRAGLDVTSPTVAEAQRKNTDEMNAFLADVKKLGVKDDDRKTVSYTIMPKYEDRRTQGTGIYVRPVLVGYVVSQSVELKVRNFDKLGDVIAAVGAHNLNQVGDFSFGVDKPDQIQQQALEKAIMAARAKASALARAGGVRLGRMITFSEGGGYMPYRPEVQKFAMGTDVAAAPPAPTLEPGRQDIEAFATVTYELLP